MILRPRWAIHWDVSHRNKDGTQLRGRVLLGVSNALVYTNK